jgi:transcriptional regulator with XRE-family HTH domain
MLESGITQAQIAKESRLSRSYVCQVISGVRKNALVNTLLRGHGCPEEYLTRKTEPKKAA